MTKFNIQTKMTTSISQKMTILNLECSAPIDSGPQYVEMQRLQSTLRADSLELIGHYYYCASRTTLNQRCRIRQLSELFRVTRDINRG